jgi:hypothetical protein
LFLIFSANSLAVKIINYMKKTAQWIFLFFLAVAICYSCTKEAGAVGPQGAQGPVGPAGQNGTVMYSGNGAPSASLGDSGDFYLDLASGNLYGPKTASGWGTPTSLKGANGAAGSAGATGATGATGAAGSQIHSGTTVPAASLGAIGDYYLDVSTYMLYGPKTASGWGTPISLQGPQGPAGPQGPQGPTGNANVQVDTFTVKLSSQWLYNSQYSFETSPGSYTEYFTRYYDASFSAITTSIIETGMVMVYVNPNPLANPNQWAPLTYRFLDGSGDFYYVMGYQTYAGEVELDYFFEQIVSGATLPTLYSYTIPAYSFKIFAVSSTSVSNMKQAGVDLNNYNQVNRYTGAWLSEKGRNTGN